MTEINFTPFPQLSTQRMILRKMNDGDAAQVFKMRSDEKVMKYIGKKIMVTIEEATSLIALLNDSIEKNTGITWAMTLKENPEVLIGTIGLWRIMKEHFRAEIGYTLLPEYWRKGYTKEGIFKMIDFGFNELGLHSIEGRITPLNEASAGVLVSTGFVKEAHFKEDFFFNGKFEDTAIYSILNK
ncbi:MAG: GNAT family N-acetyltransferase [Ginsengibacter sp.]